MKKTKSKGSELEQAIDELLNPESLTSSITYTTLSKQQIEQVLKSIIAEVSAFELRSGSSYLKIKVNISTTLLRQRKKQQIRQSAQAKQPADGYDNSQQELGTFSS